MGILMQDVKAFAKEYFARDFADYQHLLLDLVITDDLVTTQCPAMEIPLPYPLALETLYQYCAGTATDQFKRIETSKLWHYWYTPPRSEKWSVIHCKAAGDFLMDVNANIVPNPLDLTHDDLLLDLCQKVFGDWWASIRDLKLMKLEPGGWCNPHRDRHSEEFGICYFWIPMHEFPQRCLKIFPLGWLQQRVGNMYLFHQSRLPHAVQHTQDFDRYVMVGRFFPELVPPEIMDTYLKKKHQYRDFFLAS